MRLATPVRHAFEALSLLAVEPGRARTVPDLARQTGLPKAALAKVLQKLAAAGLLLSQRGPGGGYRLARGPRRITLSEVVACLRAEAFAPQGCLLSHHPCRASAPCALHNTLLRAEALVQERMAGVSVASLAFPRGASR